MIYIYFTTNPGSHKNNRRIQTYKEIGKGKQLKNITNKNKIVQNKIFYRSYIERMLNSPRLCSKII